MDLEYRRLLVCMCIMVAVTVVLTYQVERHTEKQGSYSFIKNPLLSRQLMYIIIRNIHMLISN